MQVLIVILLLMALPGYAESRLDQIYGRLELGFEANKGQTDPEVEYFARGRGYGLFLTRTEAVLSLNHPEPAAVHMRLVDGSRKPLIEGLEPLPGTTQYLRGGAGGARLQDVPSYRMVRYTGVYRGIDVVYYGNQRQLEYDFVVKPGSDPSQIRIAFDGVRDISLTKDGDLRLRTQAADLIQKKPIAYQRIDGTTKDVAASYRITGNEVRFSIGDYDRAEPLILDPVLVYSSFIGGTATSGAIGDRGLGVAVDATGNAYVTGYTASPDFPRSGQAEHAGAQDAFVLKLNAEGTAILFSLYFGGSGNDEGHSIALDTTGNILVAGSTLSSNFPVVNARQRERPGGQDAFVLKLNNSGTNILYSTYLGGAGDDRAFGVAVDIAGNAYVTGIAGLQDFPIANAYQASFGGGLGDAFVTKLSPDGALVYSTFVGGIGHDQAYSIAVDGNGNAYVTGFTTSLNFPLSSNAPQTSLAGGSDDGFIFKLSPDGGRLVYSTYFGGGGSDNPLRLAVDPEGQAVVTGTTTSSIDFPITNAIQGLPLGGFEAFVMKWNAEGSGLLYSTFLGGSGADSGVGIALDSAGNTYVTGFTSSFEFAAINALQTFNGGDRDIFVVKLTPDGSKRLFSTYIGGAGAEGALGIAVDAAANVYVTGFTASDNFPTANPFQGTKAGGQDGFILKLSAADIVTSSPFTAEQRGGTVIRTGGASAVPTFGYATAEAANADARPTGLAVLSLEQSTLLTGEVGIVSPQLIRDGRFFVEGDGRIRSVLSIANTSDEEATVEFYFTDQSGISSKAGSTTVPARSHFSRFVEDVPLSLGATDVGTLTFSSSVPVAATAFRTFNNERSEFLIASIPIADLNNVPAGPLVIPHFTEGLGWSTHVVLVNTSEERMNGEIRFLRQGSATQPGQPVEVPIAGDPAAVYEYDIPPRSYHRFVTRGTTEELIAGSVRVTPFTGTKTPSAHALILFSQSEVTELQTYVPAQVPQARYRLFAESAGEAGAVRSIRTAVAVANPANAPAIVRLELFGLDGASTGRTANITVSANGQAAFFLHEVPGFEDLPAAFQGVVQLSSEGSSGVGAVSMRTRINERGGFLATATGPIIESAGAGSMAVFPHIAEGGGYSTQVVILSGTAGIRSAGVLRFIDQEGQPINLTLR